MSERELIAMMAATMVAGAYAGNVTFTIPDVVVDAEKILAETDRRAELRSRLTPQPAP